MGLKIGQVIYGYCGGVFGREFNAYKDKRVEAIGFDWVVLRDEDGNIHFAVGDELQQLEEHTTPPEENENES